mmetsp:Transcript_1990/g.3642  ORF Transcript_1990/g.3642 Transcript_1990/m.3642 type:complete len:584 (-) Transcript_1990:176-1927(-)
MCKHRLLHPPPETARNNSTIQIDCIQCLLYRKLCSTRNSALSLIVSGLQRTASTTSNITQNKSTRNNNRTVSSTIPEAAEREERSRMTAHNNLGLVANTPASTTTRSSSMIGGPKREERRWNLKHHHCRNDHNNNNNNDKTNDTHPYHALLDRSEVVLGDLLGKGAFCVVHELQDIRLNNAKLRPYFSLPWWEDKFRQVDRTREYIRQTCQDETGNPRYAIKQLRPGLATDRGHKVFVHAASDLVMEFEILSRLSHPNIVQLRGGAVIDKSAGVAIDKANYFLVLEKLEETLTQRIHYWKRMGGCPSSSSPGSRRHRATSKGSLGLQPYFIEKLQFARDIASALAYIHSKSLLFRDLKPDNCAIGLDGKVKLLDFGLCRELPDASKATGGKKEPMFRMSGVGTRRYMSPEMIVGRGYNQKVDCYSWAMVFYEMLSLQKPYASYNREVHRILVCENKERPYPPVDISSSVRDLLQEAWAHDPCERPSMQDVYDQLGPMVESAERQAMSPHERSLKVVMEMAELLTLEDHQQTVSRCAAAGSVLGKNDYDSFISRKSTAELTVSTATSSATAEASLLPTPPVIFC